MSTLLQLRDAVRGRVDDAALPYLCSDALLTQYANDAQNEACRRARLLLDSTTVAVCSLTIVALTVTYTRHASILFIRRAKWTAADGSAAILRPVSSRDLDKMDSSWDTQTGRPRGYVIDTTTGQFRPFPTPDVAGTVALTVIRTPLAALALDADVPEIPARFHAGLENWMRKRYYDMQDAEIKDPKKAAEAELDFEREFGKKSSAIDETWLQREAELFEDEGNF